MQPTYQSIAGMIDISAVKAFHGIKKFKEMDLMMNLGKFLFGGMAMSKQKSFECMNSYCQPSAITAMIEGTTI